MTSRNSKSLKQKSIEIHSKLKIQFLKLYSFPFVESDFLAMVDLLEIAGVDKNHLTSFLNDGKFDFEQYSRLIKLSEDTIVLLHSQISKMS